MEINETSYSNCSTNYYVFENAPSYLPIPNEKGEAICLLNNDNITASWSITKSCEPSCSIRKCDNEQICASTGGISRCLCTGYMGKYCETDINECLTNNGGCDSNSICTNTLGTFSCSCKEGYSGNGFTCNLSQNEKGENSQAVGIGVGVTFGLLALIILVLLILFFLRKKVNFRYFFFIMEELKIQN